MVETRTPTAALGARSLRLRAGRYVAEVVAEGATLRALTHGGRDLILPFDAGTGRPAMRGALLAPWPNRVAGARYAFEGVEHRLAVSEPERGHAAHGLVHLLPFEIEEAAEDAATLVAHLDPQPGYPWPLRVRVRFVLSPAGLSQEVTVTNLGAAAAPVGIGGHPYLVAGDAGPHAIDAWTLTVPADRVLRVDGATLIPTALAAVEDEPDLDRRRSRPVGGTAINHAFTGLRRGDDGLAAVRVEGPDRATEIVWDARCPWVQVYTADEDGPPAARAGIAVEPMTCPPDAFGSGTDLITLQPGASTSAGWTIRDATRHRTTSGGARP